MVYSVNFANYTIGETAYEAVAEVCRPFGKRIFLIGGKLAMQAGKEKLEDGVYTAEFHTDSSMFHANETKDGKGTLTVKDGKMVFHVTLHSKNIVNLFPGKAEDAQKDGAELLQPTVDTVTYSDGTTEEVYGFDIPVTVIDQEFDLALIGKKGVWYDHKVSIENPVKDE
jgi:hypothetical protein